MHILSLFDWISCGRIALERAWIQVDKYFASEIDKYAIEIAKKNYPDTIHIGSVTDVHYLHFSNNNAILNQKEHLYFETSMDIIIGWPPCQDLSIAKKDRKWLEWEKSSLFFEYLRILKEVRPKYFIMENVASMSQENKKIITAHLLEVYPDTVCHKINSNIYWAQNRKRLFWTNIQGYKEPEDEWIYLRDILEDIPMDDERWKPIPEKYLTKEFIKKITEAREKSLALTASYAKKNIQNYMEKWDGQVVLWVKSYPITATYAWACPRDYLEKHQRQLVLWIHQIPRGKNNGNIHTDKSPTVTSNEFEHNNKLVAQNDMIYVWRKLTCIECERLMNIQDNYTDCVSATRRYHAIGNAFDPAIIADFLKLIK